MPATGRQVHIDTPLSNMLSAAFETQGDFVASNLFPVVSVGKRSDKYYVLQKEAWLRQPHTARAPRTKSNRIEFDISSDSYYAQNYALTAEIPAEDLANADTALNIRQSHTALVTRGLLADLEIRVQNRAISNVSTVQRLTGADAWDAVNSADIRTQVGDAKLSIFNQTGLVPNSLVLDFQSYEYARRNTRLYSLFQYGPAAADGFLSNAQMMAIFDVQNLWIARSQKNNANENQTGSYTSIWGPTALLARVEPALTLMTATYGVSMRWTSPELGVPMAVQTSMEDGAGSRHIELLEGMYYQDEKVVASALGFYINTKSGTPW